MNDIERRLDKIEKDIEKLELANSNACMVQMKDKYELKELIAEAVEKGNDKIMKTLKDHETRIVGLENQDGKKAILILKSVGATTLGWIVLGILNHIITIFER